jgi:gas vesicle protein GvpO
MAQSSNGKGKRLSAEELGKAALNAVRELTGYTPESVTALEWDGDDDVWAVKVDVLELSRIPNTTDVIGEYVIKLDEAGKLHGYRRERRYQRGQVTEG